MEKEFPKTDKEVYAVIEKDFSSNTVNHLVVIYNGYRQNGEGVRFSFQETIRLLLESQKKYMF